jgi:hypothetical protein
MLHRKEALTHKKLIIVAIRDYNLSTSFSRWRRFGMRLFTIGGARFIVPTAAGRTLPPRSICQTIHYGSKNRAKSRGF